ncbi:MAG TPA: alcohol dehydrogenase catalytic domain-containing protein [Acidobacteriota bacterium]
MLAAVLSDVKKFELRDVPRPVPGSHEVLVEISAVGLCGTDFHIYSGEANYNLDARGRPIPLAAHPQILGHEIVGVVREVGRDVRDLKEGTAAVLDQGLNCRSSRRSEICEYCASGSSHQCRYYRELGITGLPGGFAQYVSIAATNVLPIRSSLEATSAALTEPLACIVRAMDLCQRAGARFSIGAQNGTRVQSVVILGAGPAGLLFTQYLRRVLGYEGLLIVSEPNQGRRESAARFGAEAINPASEDLVDFVDRRTKGRRAELVIEASGSSAVFSQIQALICKQATILLYAYGYYGGDLGLLNGIHFHEPTFLLPAGGSGGFNEEQRPLTYLRALRLIEEGKIEAASLITHRYEKLESVPRAFSGEHRRPDYVKGVVIM